MTATAGPVLGYCDRCGHRLALHAEAGRCMFTCDCEPGMCGCDRSDLLLEVAT
jgi:hypothetical protein